MGISAKLLELIGDESVQNWAERHGLAKQTVHEWIKHDRTPGKNSLTMLCQATGTTPEHWLSSDRVKKLSVSHTSTKPIEARQMHADLYIDNYVEVRASAGAGQLTPTDQLILQLKVNAADWRRYIGLDHRHIKLINVHGDSMKPTLSHGDQVMVDTACSSFVDDAIYCIQQGDNLRFKRIKLNLDGSIIVRSDNEREGYPAEVYTADEAAQFRVIGRVIPLKFGWFEI